MYAKMDHTFLDSEDFRASIQIEWDQAQVDFVGVHPRIQWEKVQKHIKKLFQQEKNRGERADQEPDLVAKL